MTNKNSTKRALMLSMLSLLLCCSMLIGTTFAWFTDSVSSGNNIIKSGNLDVDVYYGDPAAENSIEGVDTLFNDVTLWEPGAVAYENLTVANKGSLALKYQMAVNFGNENYVIEPDGTMYGLSDILQIAIVEGGVDETLTREELVASIPASDWAAIDNFTLENELLANTNADPVGFVIWWNPSDADNNFNVNNGKETSDFEDHLHIELGVTLVATQYTYEDDSFDEKYDESAEYPLAVGGTMAENSTEDLVLNAGRITVIVPAGSPAGGYKLDVNSLSLNVDSNNVADLDTNFGVTKNGAAQDGVNYKVQIQIDVMATDVVVTHKGENVTNFDYDPFTGLVEFTTTSFSPFTVDYSIFGEAVRLDAEAREIHSGIFTGVNPATLDASLLGDDSKYIAVDFVKDGVKSYCVSERASTVILGDAETNSDYTFENGSYTVKKIADNKLYAEISALQNKDHSTVYLLPGTYNEATTIGVYSNMDIIGLGDAEDILVKKVGCHSTNSTKPSNRHLFNCNGTKADYIRVILRNLTVDATEQNSYIGKFFGKDKQMFEDNAAVQSIRKTKVKCYDLNVVKGAGTGGVAFYVNGNNAVNGVKYTAYLYAEHCTLDATREYGVVTTSGTYKFYHNGVTYGGTAYTKNSGSIKSVQMNETDWEW